MNTSVSRHVDDHRILRVDSTDRNCCPRNIGMVQQQQDAVNYLRLCLEPEVCDFLSSVGRA